MADAGHDIYAKSWVSQFNDKSFLGLSCLERGFWMQLYTWAKGHGDTGVVSFRSFTAIGQNFGTEKRTASRVVTRLREISRIYVQEEPDCITIEIINYDKHQHVRQSSKRESFGKITPSGQDITGQDITGAPVVTEAKEYWMSQYQDKMGLKFEGVKADFIAIADLMKKVDIDEFKKLADWILSAQDKWFSEHRTPRELRRSLNEIRLKIHGVKSTTVKVAQDKYSGIGSKA